MAGPLILQLVLLTLALTLAARVLSAEPQNQIALVVDAQGRTVYVNADVPPTLLRASSRGLRHDSPAPPAAIRQVIGETAGRFDVDPQLVDAVVRVESGYDSHAISPKGAQGLMQLIPATAARFGVQNPFDPAENVRGGVTYLSSLLKQFGGDVPLTLAAYNAGEGAVQRYGGIPPYAETQDYVRKVTGLYAGKPATGVAGWSSARLAGHLPTAASRGSYNAASAVSIYQYVDEHGVTHFAQ